MSDPFTVVVIEDGVSSDGYAARGFVSRGQAIAEAYRHFRSQATEAQYALAALEAGRVAVFHQRGLNAPRNRVELPAS